MYFQNKPLQKCRKMFKKWNMISNIPCAYICQYNSCLSNLICSLIGLAPRIAYLSYPPGNSVNDCIDEKLATVQYSKFDNSMGDNSIFSVFSNIWSSVRLKIPLNSKLLGDKDCLHWIWPVKKWLYQQIKPSLLLE
jgi:hypothetical protein